MADVREGAVERDPVADVNVESILPVGLVHPVSSCQGEWLPLFTIAYKHTNIVLVLPHYTTDTHAAAVIKSLHSYNTNARGQKGREITPSILI